jgi:mannose-6-phosphate isomerase-like protein (cupin superfamily)
MNELESQLFLTGERAEVFASVAQYLAKAGFIVVSQDFTRPWGGFFVLDESQAQVFSNKYFPNVDFSSLKISGKLSPKILMVETDKRLSWQYHHRRAEIWKLVAGQAGVVTSETDEEGPVQKLKVGEIIRLKQGQRHRLIGVSGAWGMVAEIWQHTEVSHPSDESDIVRVQDDFGR